MTRVNLGIAPYNLCDQHLIAEHREIKRIPNTLLSGKFNRSNIPSKFTLGTGHVKFFYNKLTILRNRYTRIYSECLNREFNVTNYMSTFNNAIDMFLHNEVDYEVTDGDVTLITNRISSKLKSMKENPRFYGKAVSADFMIQKLLT